MLASFAQSFAWITGALLGLYLLAVGALYAAQSRFIYPGAIYTRAASLAPDGFELVSTRTADGLTLWALWRAPAPGMPVAVFFHGNGSSARHATYATAALARAGFGLLLPEYRGYGGNPGTPTEAGLYADARGALEWLNARGIAPADTVIVGNSIGTGPATEIAATTPVRALVLISPFTRLSDVAAEKLRWMPAGRLVRDRYDNLSKIGHVSAPILILHGSNDRLIPISHAEALAGASGATLARLPFGHELAWRPQAGIAAARWLQQTLALR